ncbi:hypothetical protein Bca52824_065397 [Brassica carinata]|uniref:Uncharacterized protein n=1 Tax=Brassica carinata TaxID=52824 RepID=A0A8X7U9L6_BRACI|nr:hypothetical protein Bca52824_065397 [Brassica carinata]
MHGLRIVLAFGRARSLRTQLLDRALATSLTEACQLGRHPAILNSSAFRRSTVSFGLLINDEEKAARKAQEEKFREWRYNKRTADMRAQYERDQEKEAKKSRLERDKWKNPLSKEETPSTKTEEKRNKGLERWLESFKAKIHQRITNPRPSPVLEEDQEAKDIEPGVSTVYVRAESMDDQLCQEKDLSPVFAEEKDLGPIFDEEEDLGPIFDEEEEPEVVSVILVVQKVADSGQEADHEKDLTTAYASGDILDSFSRDKLVQPFVCKEYDPVKLLRHEEGTIRACSKAHYRSESVKFHWLLDFSSLGVVLVDILEESNSATELLRFLRHMAHCFRGARSSFGSSSFCIRD